MAKAPEYTMQAAEGRATSTRHDDWLHRGPFLADLPWHVYMRRVRRARKPSRINADYAQIFFFDEHYVFSTLYCQEIRYSTSTVIPRMIGSVCPPEEEDDGEPHAAYKLMLFSRARCPGPEHCADPLIFRSLMIPSDRPDDDQLHPEKPRWKPCWKTCKYELALRAKNASAKERRAEKIAVIADTTIMKEVKDSSGDVHSAARLAFRLRPLLLKILASVFDKHRERMPHGIVDLVDQISHCLCGISLYHLDEQLDLAELAALEAEAVNRNIDKEILVRRKPFRDEQQGGFVNDVDSDEEASKEANAIHSEFLGGAGEDDCDVEEDIDGDCTVRRQALVRLSLSECQAMLRRDRELERTNAPGRHKEADMQMKGYVEAFGGILQLALPELPTQRCSQLAVSLPLHSAADFQRAVAKEMRSQQAGGENNVETEAEPSLRDLLHLHTRNQSKAEDACVVVPLEDALKGPGHVAWKLIQDAKKQSTDSFSFNDEQILLIALCIWPLEQAWRIHVRKQQTTCATVNTLRSLPNDLGLPRILAIGGGGCGKTTVMQKVVVPTLRTFFRKVLLTAPSNRAARGFDSSAKTLHSVSGMTPQDSMRTSNLHIKSDQMRKRMDANQTHAGAWVHDEALQTAAALWHAAALRTTYAREHVYKLDTRRYAQPMK